ncbi:MAG: aminotransferase class V-fold PLP-dependent enzyme [Thermaerobacter sp.]|nr:aminotransferase class V-fold PLP-dependent enzyme [Thermaerobacter sp.]
MPEYPLEPGRNGMEQLGRALLEQAIGFVQSLAERPADGTAAGGGELGDVVRDMLMPPPAAPGDLAELLERVQRAMGLAVETAGAGYFGYIPGGGLFASAVADVWARAANRYVGIAGFAPGLAAMEHSVVRWFCQVLGLPAESGGGLLVSGGSMANFSAVVAARHAQLGEEMARGALYLTEHAHHSLGKAARLAGLPANSVRTVPCTPDLRMDVDAAAALIAADRAAGQKPFLLVASAGTTNTGTVDPLLEMAALAAQEGLWFHVDGAYGGLFRLTERGRARLQGIELADSVTLDPHKSLFLPYGTGALAVRDGDRLRAAHAVSGHYLQDLEADRDVPDFADLGLELSRELRGLRVWLPLHLYGTAAFRAALDEKLDLAEMAYRRLAAESLLEVPWAPDLSVVAFRLRRVKAGVSDAAIDAANRRLLARINASQRVFLSSTVVDGRVTLRLCILSHRTHAAHVREAVDIIVSAARATAAEG